MPFPDGLPPGFEPLADEPAFDPDRHLDLEEPDDVTTLTDLGYTDDDTAGTATAIAVSSPFRILSDEGAEVMLDTARRLRQFTRRAGNRIERTVRGGCYRSTWLRGLCLSAEVNEHLAKIYGTAIAPHPMPHHLGHLNYEPSDIDEAIDKWHHDTLPLDYVLTVTDPALVDGGRFEYFAGTKAEAAELQAEGRTPPEDRVVRPDLPGPGYAIALHGDMVVHRAGPLRSPGERITMVNGYVALDATLRDQSRSVDLIGVDPDDCVYTEWARFAAWRAATRLQSMIGSLGFTDDVAHVTNELRSGIDDVERAITEMQRGAREATHYES